jgi:hypothetical protein
LVAGLWRPLFAAKVDPLADIPEKACFPGSRGVKGNFPL